VVVIVTMLASMLVFAQTKGKHMNPMVDLLQQHKPVFGVYLPSAQNLPGAAPRGAGGRGGEGGRGGRGAPRKGAEGYPPQEDDCERAAAATAQPLSAEESKQQGEIAKLALTHREEDYLFSGAFEGGIERPLPAFNEMMKHLGVTEADRKAGRIIPLMLKAPKV